MNTPGPDQQYIGDGVYASFDGYQIILETRNGYQTTNRIALDNKVLTELDRYAKYVKEFYQEVRETRNREKTSTPADSWGQ